MRREEQACTACVALNSHIYAHVCAEDVQGKDYYFISKDLFQKLIESNRCAQSGDGVNMRLWCGSFAPTHDEMISKHTRSRSLSLSLSHAHTHTHTHTHARTHAHRMLEYRTDERGDMYGTILPTKDLIAHMRGQEALSSQPNGAAMTQRQPAAAAAAAVTSSSPSTAQRKAGGTT